MTEPIFTPRPDITTFAGPVPNDIESFAPTGRLRWLWRNVIGSALVLQQQWQGSSGTVQWRDVETVQEGAE